MILALLHHGSLIQMGSYVDQGPIQPIAKLCLCREIPLFEPLSCLKSLVTPRFIRSIYWTLHLLINVAILASVGSNRRYDGLVLQMRLEVLVPVDRIEVRGMLATSSNFHPPLQGHRATCSGFQRSHRCIFFLCTCASSWLVLSSGAL